MKIYNQEIEDVLDNFGSSLEGITNMEASHRLEKYGLNKIKETKGKSKWNIFIDQFKDSMIIILIVVAVLMFVYGLIYSHDYVDTIVIAVVVLLNAIMGFIQEEKAYVTLKGLRKYTVSSSKVKRDGKVMVIDSLVVIPGDIIILEAGDKVPVDARIIKEVNLSVDESPLTGESLSVKKLSKILSGEHILQEQVNMLFCGCNIVNGSAEAIVVRTGMQTELGMIAESLNTPYEVETPLQIKIKEISRKITLLVFIIVLLMFGYGLFMEYKLMEIIMLCVSLAVAAIPEGLPAVITIALSGGTASLAKRKTIVRQMSAVETIGSTDIICSDKTGTITQNKMKIEKVITNNDKMLQLIMLLANEVIVDNKVFVGDPTETALYDYLVLKGLNVNNLRKDFPRITSIPFDSERKIMSSINEMDGKYYLLVKGSVENLLIKCKYINMDNDKVLLNDKYLQEIKNDEKEMADDALRVIGFAYKLLDSKNINNDNLFTLENELIYVGMVGMIDPPREAVKEAVIKCRKASIRPIMITGDSLVTACAIAKDVGIIKDSKEGLLGSELDKYSDQELVEVVKKYNVYARVSPLHKSRIVKAWQANDKVVAMTGDGVNDASAIKDAHVGIGMGITGTEVTKSVADIVLLDDSFATIVQAVEEGRRIFTNITNNVVYSLSSNFAELFIVLIGMFTGYSILLPIQILFIDLVTDTIPSICLSFEKASLGIMKKPPRGINKPIFTPFIKVCIIYSAVVETVLALIVYFISMRYYNSNIASSLALLSIVLQEMLYAVSCRNLKDYWYKQGVFTNKTMNIGLVVVLIVEMIFFLTPVGKLIHLTPINFSLFMVVGLFNLIGLGIYEVAKPILRKKFSD